ncbi:MAG: hypothetical protein WBV22_08995 [Anaerolineaceae bacterium]
MKKALKYLRIMVFGSLVVLLVIPSTIFAADFIGSLITISAETSPEVLKEVSPSIAYDSQRQAYLVVWYNDRPGCDDIRGQRLSKNGTLLGGPFYISAGCPNERYHPDVTYDSTADQYLVVWQDYHSSAGTAIKGRRVSGAGVVLDATDITIRGAGAPTWNAYTPVVAYGYTSDRYLVVYEEVWAGSFCICGNLVDSDGNVGSQITIGSCNASEELQEPDVAYNVHANRFLVVWEESYGSEWDIRGQQIRANDGGLYHGVYYIAGEASHEERNPAVAALPDTPNNDKFLVVYEQNAIASTDHDIYGIIAQEEDGWVGMAFGIATYGSRNETGPAVAGNDSDLQYFVTWLYNHDGTFIPIRGQAVTYAGALTGQLQQVLPTASDANNPAVAAGPVGDFLVAWQDDRYTTDMSLYGRIYGNRTYLPVVVRP